MENGWRALWAELTFCRLCTDPEGPRVKKFLAEFYDKVDFVGQEKYMGTLDVYIRRMGNGGE